MKNVVERIPLEKRFWEKVAKTQDCWFWIGAKKGRSGAYGCIRVNRRGVYAHRVAYELIVGKIPEGMQLDHLCRNTLCVNPKHLEPVTNKENILRGIGPTSENAKMTRCRRGHDFSPENTYIGKSGSRQCNACRRYNYSTKQQRCNS